MRFLSLLLILPEISLAQIIIPTGSILSASTNTHVVILTPYNIVNNSTFDFSSAKLALELNGAKQDITGNLVLVDFLLSGEGSKTINGNVTVTNKFEFNKGILSPSATSKLLFTGAEDGITGGNNSSFCDGVFYSSGSGKRIFPLGIGATYASAEFESIASEVGVKITNGSALLSFDTAEIVSINQSRYWEIKTDFTKINSGVTLSLNGLDTFANSEGGTTVIQANSVGGLAQNLGSSSSSSNPPLIASREKVSASILALGKEKKITVRIHDLITPSGADGVNDKLTIENINKFDHNKVTLLDRWGTRVTEWINFTNDVNYDFNKLSAGNYICIVEYGNTGEANQVKQQMVTVLKIN